MKKIQRAYIVDENTSEARYFILIETKNGSSASGNVRFNCRKEAERICLAINKAYENENRLLDWYNE